MIEDLGVVVKRVSGGIQEKNTSRDTQEEDARALAKRNGIQVVEVFDEGVVGGGFYLSRDGLQEAILGVEMGKWKHIIFGQFDRSARDVVNLETIYKRVYAAGGKIHHADITFEESDIGTLMRQQFGAMKEYERKSIKTRTAKGRWARARQGIQPLRANPLYGYYIPLTVDADEGRHPRSMVGKYIIVEENAAIVRLIYHMFVVDLLPYNAIADYLNAQGIPSPHGGRWAAETIKKLLANSAYRGIAIFGKMKRVTDETRRSERGLKTTYVMVKNVETGDDLHAPVKIPCEPIIEATLWDDAQERMRKVSKDHSEVKGHCGLRGSVLGGIVKCPECRSAMNSYAKTQRNGNKVRYYRCPFGVGMRKHTKRQAIINCTNGKIYNSDKLDAQAIKIVLEVSRNPALITKAIEAYENDFIVRDAKTARRVALENEFRELAKREDAATRLKVEDAMAGRGTETYDKILDEVAVGRKRVLKAMEDCPAAPQSLIPTKDRQEQFNRELAIVSEMLCSDEIAPSAKNKLLSEVIEGAEVIGPERTLQLCWRGGSIFGAVSVPVISHANEGYQLSTLPK